MFPPLRAISRPRSELHLLNITWTLDGAGYRVRADLHLLSSDAQWRLWPVKDKANCGRPDKYQMTTMVLTAEACLCISVISPVHCEPPQTAVASLFQRQGFLAKLKLERSPLHPHVIVGVWDVNACSHTHHSEPRLFDKYCLKSQFRSTARPIESIVQISYPGSVWCWKHRPIPGVTKSQPIKDLSVSTS